MLKESIFVREGGALNLFQSLVHSLKDVLINFAGFRIMCQKLWQFSTRRNCYPAIYGRIERFAKTHNWWQHQTKNPWNASNLGNGFSKFSSLSNCYSESFNNRFLRERGMASNPKMEYQVFLSLANWDSQLGRTFSLPSQRNFPISFKPMVAIAEFFW